MGCLDVKEIISALGHFINLDHRQGVLLTSLFYRKLACWHQANGVIGVRGYVTILRVVNATYTRSNEVDVASFLNEQRRERKAQENSFRYSIHHRMSKG